MSFDPFVWYIGCILEHISTRRLLCQWIRISFAIYEDFEGRHYLYNILFSQFP